MSGASAALSSPWRAIAATIAMAQSRTAEFEVVVMATSAAGVAALEMTLHSCAHRRRLARQMILEAERHAPVDHQLMSGRIARLVRHQERNGFRDVVGRAERSDRDARSSRCAHLG